MDRIREYPNVMDLIVTCKSTYRSEGTHYTGSILISTACNKCPYFVLCTSIRAEYVLPYATTWGSQSREIVRRALALRKMGLKKFSLPKPIKTHSVSATASGYNTVAAAPGLI